MQHRTRAARHGASRELRQPPGRSPSSGILRPAGSRETNTRHAHHHGWDCGTGSKPQQGPWCPRLDPNVFCVHVGLPEMPSRRQDAHVSRTEPQTRLLTVHISLSY